MKWICSVCGYVHEGDTPPENCPLCKAPASKFNKASEEKVWASEHKIGVDAVYGVLAFAGPNQAEHFHPVAGKADGDAGER